jgi:hypothetical protein
MFSEFQYGAMENFTSLYNKEGSVVAQLLLAPSYLCGMSCHMCTCSTSRFNEYKKVGYKDLGLDFIIPTKTKIDYELTGVVEKYLEHLKTITFVGSDPLLIKEVPDILDMLAGREDTRIIFLINGHRDKLTDDSDVIDRLKKHPNLQLVFSTDGDEYLNARLRRGYNHQRWMTLFNRAKSELPQADIGISTTISTASVMRIKEIADYLNALLLDSKIWVSFCGVTKPSHYATGNLPYNLKSDLLKKIHTLIETSYYSHSINYFLEEVAGVIRETKFNPQHWQTFLLENQRLDALYDTNMLDLNPEFEPYWVIG